MRGKVQGVFFRANLSHVAELNSVVGWVKNNPDGSVEAVLQGGGESVKKVLDWAHRGPPGARVDSVRVEEISPHPDLRDFRVVR